MPIEFRCTSCNRLLRVGDDTAGKRAKCPQCATVLTIPTPAADPGFVAAQAADTPTATPPTRAAAAPPASSNRIAAGICGILVGALGIHKFILGLTTPAIIMLLVTLLTCGIGGAVMGIIGLVEGIIYLTKSDAEFYQRYIVEKKGWF